MDILMISGFALVAMAMSVTLKKYGEQHSMLINIAVGMLIAFIILSNIIPVVTRIKNLILCAEIPSEYGIILFKSLGICFVAQFTIDSCKDAGANALASKVEFAAKIAIIISALPLFEKITQTAINFIGAQ